MEDLFRTLPKILNEFEDSPEVREAVIFAAWKKAAGKSLSEHAVPVSLDDKHLILAVRDETWKRHLESLAGQMIFKINSLLSRASVTFIEFQVDEKLVSEQTGKGLDIESEEQTRKLALEEVSTNLQNSAETIQDEKLRAQFLLAAGSCLVRKKKFSKSE